jgi:hypothetical protein
VSQSFLAYTVLSSKRVTKVAVEVVGNGAPVGESKCHYTRHEGYSQPRMWLDTATRAASKAVQCASLPFVAANFFMPALNASGVMAFLYTSSVVFIDLWRNRAWATA